MSGVLKPLPLCYASNLYRGSRVVSERRLRFRLSFSRPIQITASEIVDGSYTPTVHEETESNNRDAMSVKNEKTGAFQKLPMVLPSKDIFFSALRKSKKVSPTKDPVIIFFLMLLITNNLMLLKALSTLQSGRGTGELVIPLRRYMENFPYKQNLHPYERSLIDLTLGDGRYEEVLGSVDVLRKKINSVGKSQASLCAHSMSKKEAVERLNEGIKKLEEVFLHDGSAVDDLLKIAKKLRAMPVVDPGTPTLCLVGAPNVGKSSLVRVLSSGKPEVCNYPFTTRGILMGHIVLNYERFQVTDTPGLLRRPHDERNNIEKLTLAVLSHLPTAILYVHDLSGECGSSPSDQFVTYKEIRSRFQEQLWLDVISKCDLPLAQSTSDTDEGDEVARYKRFGPDGAICVSVKTEVGIPEVRILHPYAPR
ncbi:Nucleolar GTP-binding protein 1 [Nymphaea thermarum]|nr:Nucleolar GTP-binding protein 1 [Nymphaea thermarum]